MPEGMNHHEALERARKTPISMWRHGLERRCLDNRVWSVGIPTDARHQDCAWCGAKPKRLYNYQTGRLLFGISGESKWFCNFRCFRSFQ